MEKWRKDREIERERDRKKKEQESAEAISGLKKYSQISEWHLTLVDFLYIFSIQTCSFFIMEFCGKLHLKVSIEVSKK